MLRFLRLHLALVGLLLSLLFQQDGGGDDKDKDTGEKSSDTGDATGKNGGNKDDKQDEKPLGLTQSQLNAIIDERLKRQKDQFEEDQRKAKEAEDAEKLKADQKWQELAEANEKKATELAPFKTKAERLETALKAQLETARKDLPSVILSLLDKIPDPAEQLEWIAANQAEINKGTGSNGIPPTGRGAGGTKPQDAATSYISSTYGKPKQAAAT